MSFALFNALVLVSRLSNGFLGPLIAKRVEAALVRGAEVVLVQDFRLFIAAATMGAVCGAVLVPTAQRLFATAIGKMQKKPSLAHWALRVVTPSGLRTLRQSVTVPKLPQRQGFHFPKGVTWKILLANCLAQAILVVGVLASIYAGYLNPEFRVTASQLSALINGFATILLFLFIDPHLSMLTDDVVDGQLAEAEFRRSIIWISVSRVAGTLLAQLLFVPAAVAIAWTASMI